MLEHGVAQQSDLHPPDAGEPFARDVGRELPSLDGFMQSRQRLGTKERRCEELVSAGDFDSFACQVKDGTGIDDEPRQDVSLT
jgi:hypothetical protein